MPVNSQMKLLPKDLPIFVHCPISLGIVPVKKFKARERLPAKRPIA
jgi:hypothetical protein